MIESRPRRPQSGDSLPRLLMVLLFALPALMLLAGPVAGQIPPDDGCDRAGCGPIRQGNNVVCFTPAKPAPASLWGELQPVDPNPLPAERDTTNFNEVTQNYASRNWFNGVDIENGWVLAGLAHGIGIWDARTNPAAPTFVTAKRWGPNQAFPYIPAGESSKIVFGGIDAPEGNDRVAAIVGYNGAGILVFDLSDKSSPKPVYQDYEKTGESVYTVNIGGTNYAYFPSSSGLFIYNLDRAVASNGCLESGTISSCSGVRVGQVSTPGTPYFAHGVGNYLVVSYGSSRGFSIYDISNPAVPQLRMSAFQGTTGRPVQGVAMWQEGSTLYMAARLGITKTIPKAETAIFNVSCVQNGTCSLGSPLWSKDLNSNSGSEYVTFSRSGTRPYIYVGGDGSCASDSGEIQREWLYDVSTPSAPDEVSVGSSASVTRKYNGIDVSKQVNYWTWYYRASATGFNLMAPRTGKFLGEYFYRAGRSLMDIHKLRDSNLPPSGDFSWSPAEIYPNTPVTFTDLSTGGPTSWSWSFPDGTPAAAAVQNPQVTFGSPGDKAVSLTPGKGLLVGDPRVKTVTVLDPTPQGSVASSPTTQATRCEAVTFTANATGAPTLTYEWQVLGPDGLTVTGAPQAGTKTFDWTSDPGMALGTYTGRVVVKNSHTPAGVALSKSIQLVDLPALTNISGQAPTKAPHTAAKVDFQAPTHQGATKWVWNFGDGTVKEFTNATEGKNPSYTYKVKGNYNVTVAISNCTNPQGFTSQPLAVEILEITPLAAGFQATLFCQFGQCFADSGKPIQFTNTSTGAEFYDYDWNHTGQSAGNCNFTDANHTTPVTSHTYATAGVYSPCLRVRRGANEQSVVVHGAINVSSGSTGGGGNNPAISVTGPSSGNLNQGYTFSATPSNCTANSTGWSWSVGGGSVTGESNTSSITISWSTTGSKTVSATNNGCSGAQGVRNIAITDPGNGGGNPNGPLQAAFSFTPSAPKPGETVSFNATSSSGSPATYGWDFGDGATGGGATATHAYAASGNYVVRLTVTKPGIGAGCYLGTCISEISKAVVVGTGTSTPTLSNEFTASVACANQFGFEQCQAETGKAVTLTASAENATSYLWEFGDGSTANGRSVTKTWATPNSYSVTLVVSNGQSTLQKTKIFIVSGAATAASKSVVLPWIAQTRGALDQSSDLYVHNPGTTPMEVTLEFRKRGLPETNPPREKRTIAPGATLYVGDALDELFERENIAGFISVKVDKGDAEPVITSFNTTFQAGGREFGQTVSGVSMSQLGAAASAGAGNQVQSLVGLINNDERLTYFGISNPSDEPSTYHLRFYDKDGRMVGESETDLTLSRFSQRQYQARELTELFGISNLEDYRVEIETKSGGTVIPYASNLRLASEDPSFIEPGSAKSSKVYLLGVLSAPGLNNSVWQSDVVLSNTSAQQIQADVTFTSLGLASTPTTPLRVTLAPGKTERLENIVVSQWNIRNGIGVLTVTSTAPAGVFPVVQGESYENTNPAKRFGQAMTAFSEADAAGAGKGQYLVGLRQDATHRTTLWLFNPGTGRGVYDVVYRALDGTVIGTTKDVALGGGKMRQLSPGQHPLPAAGAKDGFTVQIVVKEGKVLSAAQVINNATNDPAYIKGEVR